MGCFALDDERVVLMRNHELVPKYLDEAAASIKQHKAPWPMIHTKRRSSLELVAQVSWFLQTLKPQNLKNAVLPCPALFVNCAGGTTLGIRG